MGRGRPLASTQGMRGYRSVRVLLRGRDYLTSYDPRSADGGKYRKWATTWLGRQPGVTVECRERKPRSLPKCTFCYKEIGYCPHPGCGKRIASTIEKGVDTLI